MKKVAYFFVLITSLVGCTKFVEVDPPSNQLVEANVYNDNQTANSVLLGIYTSMSTPSFAAGINSISLYNGMAADEFILGSTFVPNGVMSQSYTNEMSAVTGTAFWNPMFTYLYRVNAAIDGLEGSKSGITPSVKQQLLGEAKFLRSFINFNLVNFYGPLPILTTTDNRINALAARQPVKNVYDQIISDLKESQVLLNSGYVGADGLTGSSERVRPNKWVASALLSRVYLYTGDWVNAENTATEIINNSALYDTVSISSNVFRKNNKEAIWQLQPVNANQNTEDARVFILTGAPDFSHPVYLSNWLINSFEAGDIRRTQWVGSITANGQTYSYPFKYKSSTIPVTTPATPVSEYLMVFRLAEQFLIRAEARAQQNNLTGAKADINLIRTRARLGNTSAVTKDDILNAVLKERQIELFSEWGHRWLDIKRTGNVDKIMSVITPQKGGTWSTTDALFPLSELELKLNPNLTQNPGY